jgi:M6 family metalloprotease-like protein
LTWLPVQGDPVWGERIILTQPDGTLIEGFIYGDEYFHRIESKEGYTLILNEQTGTVEYAILLDNRLVPSGLIAGVVSSFDLERVHFPKHLSDRKYRIAEIRRKTPQNLHDVWKKTLDQEARTQALTGTKKVFVVCVQFQPEESPPTQWSTGLYPPNNFNNRLFNDDPSDVSMTNFYRAQSYGQFWPVGYTYPSWLTLPKTASDYEDNGSWRTAISDVLDVIKNINPSYDFTQHANDGNMDIILIWAGRKQTWGDFFWPKMGSIYLVKHGVRVVHYNVVNERGYDGEENTGISTFCHEYGHMTGSPDLYDYSDFHNKPLGYYCLMGSSDHRIGFCGYIKYHEYGWVDPVEIINGGDFLIDALGLSSSANPRMYKIYIDNPQEYLLLENRNDGSDPDYENYPHRRSGLLITHVDENYPPASCLPGYRFYGVESICPSLNPYISSLYSYQAYWDEMVWGADYGYTQIGPFYPDDTPAGSALSLTASDDTENVIYRNTRGHQDNTDIHITDISSASSTMTFSVAKVSFTLELSTGAGGSTNPPPGSYTYDKGRLVSVEAVEDPYYSFTEWMGDVSLSNKNSRIVRVTMDSNKTLTANFRKIYKPLNFQGQKVLNRSLSQAEYINILKWTNNSQNSGIYLSKYRIFQWMNNRWSYITEVNASTFEYRQRYVDKDKVYPFAIVAVDFRGREGEPAYVTVH